jgi:hypothetical protein
MEPSEDRHPVFVTLLFDEMSWRLGQKEHSYGENEGRNGLEGQGKTPLNLADIGRME